MLCYAMLWYGMLARIPGDDVQASYYVYCRLAAEKSRFIQTLMRTGIGAKAMAMVGVPDGRHVL